MANKHLKQCSSTEWLIAFALGIVGKSPHPEVEK